MTHSHLAHGVRIGAFEIVGQLGAGGMGEVYRATDTNLGRQVAIKILPPEFAADPERVARFEREARTLASLNHPHIAQVYGLEKSSGSLALVMELVEGDDLSQRIARGPIPLEDALPIARQIAEALEAAHEAGIIHRDLKPANIKVRADGTVKVLDFGLAKAVDQGSGIREQGSGGGETSPTITTPAMTLRGVILGTAAYMSPEQAKGKAVDRRTDIWAFGCVLYEMLTGRRAFDGDSVTDTIAKVIEREPDFARLPATAPPRLMRVLRRCLQKDPRQRLQHIADGRLELEPPFAEAPGSAEAEPRRRLTRTLPWAIALAALLAAAAALWQRDARPLPRHSSIEISYPEGVEAQQIPQSIALSPDGRTVGMIGMKDGMRTLYLRSVDEIAATPLPQPVNPVAVVFSPDGRQLAAITSNGELWQVSPRDNAAQRIASDVDVSCGLSWSARATVFCRGGTLWVAAPGGGERQLTTLESAREEVAHGDPVTVDDRLVLFTSVSGEIGDERIEAVPLEGGSRTIVVERAASPIVGTSDRLLFVREGALMTAAFDVETRTIGPAAPVPPALAESGVDWRFPAPVLSASGALLRSAPYAAVREVVVVDRQGASRPFGVPDGNFANPRLTGDGRRLLLEQRSGPLPRIFDLASGTVTQLRAAAGAGPAAYATWNADGTRAVFRRSTMVWAATDGTGASQIVPHTRANDFPNAPGPDADSVFVTRISPETGADVYLVSLSGAYPPRPLVRTRAFDGGGSLSPDGRWLLYQSSESGANEIYLRPYPALDRVWQISEGGGVQARWNPSGREIFYRDGAKMLAVAVDLSGAEPVRQKPVLLFDQTFASSTGTATPNYDVTPDGKFVVLRPREGATRLIHTTNWAHALSSALGAAERRE